MASALPLDEVDDPLLSGATLGWHTNAVEESRNYRTTQASWQTKSDTANLSKNKPKQTDV
jgi:hypothetical protein